MLRKLVILWLLALISLSWLGPSNAATINVVASFSVLGDVVKQLGGNYINLTTLVSVNKDPHSYEPSPADAKAIQHAQIIFVSGLGLEKGWLDRLIKAANYHGQIVIASQGIKPLMVERHGETGEDPHVWNDPRNVAIWVNNIVETLSTVDPTHQAQYQSNAKHYLAQLKTLDQYARQKISAINPAQRIVLTSHDALGYFGKAYGIKLISPLGLTTTTEPSAAVIAALIDQIKQHHIKAYFFENSNDPRLVKQIAKATGAKPSGELYVESLSTAQGPAANYLQMFRYNLEQMVAAMIGKRS